MKTTSLYRTGIREANRISKEKSKMTEIGSMKYSLWGPEKSEQSLVIKFGRVCETMVKEQIQDTEGFLMLPSGVQLLAGMKKKKDVDLLFLDIKRKVIYYRELKANIELDTEKLPATSDKVKLLSKYLKKTYPGCTLDFGILCLPVFREQNLTQNKLKSKIRQFNNSGVKVTFADDIFQTLSLNIGEQEYYNFWREMGKILRS